MSSRDVSGGDVSGGDVSGKDEVERTPAKPQDVANLYSRVELDGVYHTFTATREQARARLRERTRAQSTEGNEEATAEVEAVAEVAAAPAREFTALSVTPEPIPAASAVVIAHPVFASVDGAAEKPAMEEPAKPVVRPGPSLYVMGDAPLSAPAPGSAEAQSAGDRRGGDRRNQRGESEVSRWFALKEKHRSVSPEPGGEEGQVPVLAMCSLAGGVGKTSIVASLSSVLAGRGERVLLVDASRYGLLSLYFGARDLRGDSVRSFSRGEGATPVRVLNVDPDAMVDERGRRDWLAEATAQEGESLQRVLIDVPTGRESLLAGLRDVSLTVLVPVEPNLTSVVSLQRLRGFFRGHAESAMRAVQPYFVLNKFDPALALHGEVREMLREQLGERLLPFAMRRSRVVSEALAEGMTAVDYAPHAAVVEDFAQLASWVRSVAEPAMVALPSLRWSER
jgi:cellulose synthase operon protein YhjQ